MRSHEYEVWRAALLLRRRITIIALHRLTGVSTRRVRTILQNGLQAGWIRSQGSGRPPVIVQEEAILDRLRAIRGEGVPMLWADEDGLTKAFLAAASSLLAADTPHHDSQALLRKSHVDIESCRRAVTTAMPEPKHGVVRELHRAALAILETLQLEREHHSDGGAAPDLLPGLSRALGCIDKAAAQALRERSTAAQEQERNLRESSPPRSSTGDRSPRPIRESLDHHWLRRPNSRRTLESIAAVVDRLDDAQTELDREKSSTPPNSLEWN